MCVLIPLGFCFRGECWGKREREVIIIVKENKRNYIEMEFRWSINYWWCMEVCSLDYYH